MQSGLLLKNGIKTKVSIFLWWGGFNCSAAISVNVLCTVHDSWLEMLENILMWHIPITYIPTYFKINNSVIFPLKFIFRSSICMFFYHPFPLHCSNFSIIHHHRQDISTQSRRNTHINFKIHIYPKTWVW